MNKKLYFGFGPYVAVALSGKYIDQGQTIKIAFGSDANNDDGKRVDLGLEGNVGYQFSDEFSSSVVLTWVFVSFITNRLPKCTRATLV